MNTVCKFGHADGAKRRFPFADSSCYILQEACNVNTLTLSLNDDAGIEDYTQVGGVHA